MINHLVNGLIHASTFHSTVVEDGMSAGTGFSALETFIWFIAAPVGLFLGIAAIVTVLTADRQKSYTSGDLTRID